MPSTLAGWLIYLESLHPKTIALGLERVAQVKQRLNLNPDFPVIVVGGTNGKGSVCAMLESILYAAGYRVGCYTSPHLLHYNERVRIAKQQVSDAELCASFEKIEQARTLQKLESGFHPQGVGRSCKTVEAVTTTHHRNDGVTDIPLTYFEFGTLAAMQCFIEHKVDVAILEVGLGGRLDAVNVFDNDCAIVTSVDIDHVDYLGDTREKIAFEKAGIFRKDRVAICADDNVPQAIRDHAKDVGAELWCIGSEFGFEMGETELPIPLSRPHGHPLPVPARGIPAASSSKAARTGETGEGKGGGQWNCRSPVGSRNALPIPALRGAFQLNNASAVLAALDALKEKLPVSMAAVRRGLTEVQLAGRFQFVPGKPQLILDVAHNPHAARSLADNLGGLPECPNTYAVFAMLKDKDMAGVVAAMNPHIDAWLVAGIDAPRGASSVELEQVVQQGRVNGEIKSFANIAEAVSFAYKVAGENDRIVAFGSFHTVAEVMQARGITFS